VLDVACGTGRHALPLSQQGLRVVGTDLSAVLLRQAAQRFHEAGRPVPLVRADLRRLPFHRVFQVVVCYFTSFGYFADPADDRRALDSMLGCLQPGGWLLLDLINPQRLRSTLVPESRFARDGVEVEERRRLEGDQIIKTITLTRDGRERRVQERVRLYSRDSVERWCLEAGLRSPRWFGSYAGEPATAEAPRLILLGRRAG
jgi:SAM-dependent methyltransferase